VLAGLTIYIALCLLLGVNYYADSFEDKSGLRGEPSSVEQLYRTTLYFAAQTAAYSDQVTRDENGLFAEPVDSLFLQSKNLYSAVEQDYPFLKGYALAPKPIIFSTLMSRFSFTGFFFPFTGEANVNVDTPLCLMPVTIAHELATSGASPRKTRPILWRFSPPSRAAFPIISIPAIFGLYPPGQRPLRKKPGPAGRGLLPAHAGDGGGPAAKQRLLGPV
jgi:hypothetical protein